MRKLIIRLSHMTLLLIPSFALGQTAAERRNIELVTAFYTDVFVAHKTEEASLKYLASSYIQHNPSVATGRKAFVDFFVPFFKENPEARSEIKRVMASGDLVMLHVHSKSTPSDRGSAIVDKFRVKDNQIVEHWDVIQAIPETAANANGMF